MAEHENVRKVREASEAFVKGEMGPWEELVADDVVWHEIGGRTLHGSEELRESMSDIEGVDFSGEVHDVVGNDEHVVALMKVTVGAGGENFSYRTAELYHMSDGQITERWSMAEDTQAITDFFSNLG